MADSTKDGRILLFFLKIAVFLLSRFPYLTRIKILAALIRFGVACSPSHKRVAHKNLSFVFPEKDAAWREEIIRKHCTVLAQLLVDFFRIPSLDEEWVKKHMKFPEMQRFTEVVRADPDKGAFIMTGHIGSFELAPLASAMGQAPVCIIVRDMKQKAVNEWWNAFRCTHGNSVLSRNGAVKGMIKRIKKGQDIGFLFDQNVTRNNAIFVNWFGRLAATSEAFGQLAMRLKTPVVIICVRTRGVDDYEIPFYHVQTDDLYNDETITIDEGARIITERSVAIMEKIIKEEPEAWFWFHKRWRTTPSEDIPEDFYD